MISLRSFFGSSKAVAKRDEVAKQRAHDQWLRAYTRSIKAKYDSAQTTVENERYWAMTDSRSARAALDPAIRATIRKRARYEALESGSFARGMVSAKVNDVIGRGPTLQVLTESKEFNKAVETQWAAWCKEVNLPAKLRTLATAYYVDGEAFAERIMNERLRNQVKLDIRLTEADMWTDPIGRNDARMVDGIRYDKFGNPVSYMRLKRHPGDDQYDPRANADGADTIPAENVIHWFRADRPDQRRGVSHLATALPLFAELRRYRLATIAAAEIASDYAAVMYSDASQFSESPDEMDENFLTIDIERRAMMTLPAGWKLTQLKAEQPTTQFGPFSEHILMEVGRCTHTPLNILIGSSREYNFASGRLDYLLYWNQNDTDRSDCDTVVMERIFQWWLDEALLIAGYLPNRGATRGPIEHRFVFPPRRPIDPEAAAKTDQLEMEMGHLTDEEWATREAIDLDQHYEQLSRMAEARKKIGLMIPGEKPPEPAPEGSSNGQPPSAQKAGSTRPSRGSRPR